MRASLRRLALPVIFLLASTLILQARDTPDQSQCLAALCKVWGLLKYYHPDVAQGTMDWDQALVDAIPGVRAAQSRETLGDQLMMLAQTAGPDVPTGPATGAFMRGEIFAWLDDGTVIEPRVATLLKLIVMGNQPALANRYVRGVPYVDNPDFSGDTAGYTGSTYPDEAYRLLALFRYWNMVQYFCPNRNLIDRNWEDVLQEFVPRMIQAGNATEYHLALAELIANITDTHGVAGSSVFRAYWGSYALPIQTRLIEGQTVIVKVFPRLLGGADLRVGDVISAIDGIPTATVRDRYRKYINASNDDAMDRNIDSSFLVWSTTIASHTLTVVRDGGASATVTVYSVNGNDRNTDLNASLDPTQYRLISSDVGYLGMGALLNGNVPAAMQAMAHTRAIIIDLRRYPADSTMWALLPYLEPAARAMSVFTRPDYQHPGCFRWTDPDVLGPSSPNPRYYTGRLVILMDENTQSAGEFSVMGFRSAGHTTVVGSRTAGADGNVSQINLPGGFYTYFSGITPYYPDGQPTQRVGIVPDIEVRPTIGGIRQGRDEVMEAALAYISALPIGTRPAPSDGSATGTTARLRVGKY